MLAKRMLSYCHYPSSHPSPLPAPSPLSPPLLPLSLLLLFLLDLFYASSSESGKNNWIYEWLKFRKTTIERAKNIYHNEWDYLCEGENLWINYSMPPYETDGKWKNHFDFLPVWTTIAHCINRDHYSNADTRIHCIHGFISNANCERRPIISRCSKNLHQINGIELTSLLRIVCRRGFHLSNTKWLIVWEKRIFYVCYPYAIRGIIINMRRMVDNSSYVE